MILSQTGSAVESTSCHCLIPFPPQFKWREHFVYTRTRVSSNPRQLNTKPNTTTTEGCMRWNRTEQLKELGNMLFLPRHFSPLSSDSFTAKGCMPSRVSVRTAWEGFSPSRYLSGKHRLFKANLPDSTSQSYMETWLFKAHLLWINSFTANGTYMCHLTFELLKKIISLTIVVHSKSLKTW